MLLCWQSGHVHVGQTVRYTLTYTPSEDRILPSPSHLFVKIKNTSAIPLRAAYLHGPYTIYAAVYPATFNPNQKFESAKRDGVPEFEPNVKAGSHWNAKLVVPEDIREGGSKMNLQRNTDGSARSVRWIIEVSSQILFSSTAAVHFEVLVGRDERSLELGFAAIAGKGHGEPGDLQDHETERLSEHKRSKHPKGVYSRAVNLVIEDTPALWSKPALPQWEYTHDELRARGIDPNAHPDRQDEEETDQAPRRRKKPKKLHLVILTHGLHSNIGADMLYLKESIDATAKRARAEAKRRKASNRMERSASTNVNKEGSGDPNTEAEPKTTSTAPLSGGQDEVQDDERNEDDDSDDEEVIVRGFPGNAVRTERGIKYLGKRLAKYILTTTYPDQPYLPASRSLTKTVAGTFSSVVKSPLYGGPTHAESSIDKSQSSKNHGLPYTFTSISFVGHSLGGLTQTYAIAYIHKHSPEFFKRIKPVNFVCMASPLLGLSNENPLYVKFALDFGLVGRTGQDLGLTWRAPTIARSGWSAMIAGFGAKEEQAKGGDPTTKPLLRILPTGPAHQVLRMFRNRTVYSNVVNDGIVPLRTSCLLFLDWRGLEKVENARRENGLISTVASMGWAELMGSNSTSHKPSSSKAPDESNTPESEEEMSPASRRRSEVPQPKDNTTTEDTQTQQLQRTKSQLSRPATNQFLDPERQRPISASGSGSEANPSSKQRSTSPFGDFFSFFRSTTPDPTPTKTPKVSKKAQKTFSRAQTLGKDGLGSDGGSSDHRSQSADSRQTRPTATRGDSLTKDPEAAPPPKTSVFEAARDILNPALPTQTWLIDPCERSRTIFHDRIYHPDDIPPPPVPRKSRSTPLSSEGGSMTSSDQSVQTQDGRDNVSGLKVEEKIARAYHSGLSWRKVLVRLEPDAHNNMIVRRMFANAYGWDVVKHLCDTHFADTHAAVTKDAEDGSTDRSKAPDRAVTENAEEVHNQSSSPYHQRSKSEKHEAKDSVGSLTSFNEGMANTSSGASLRSSKDASRPSREDSAVWDDSVFEGSEASFDSDEETIGPFERFQRFWGGQAKTERSQSEAPPRSSSGELRIDTEKAKAKAPGPKSADEAKIADAITSSPVKVDGHRGLGILEQLNNATAPTFNSGDVEPLSTEPLTAEAARPDGGGSTFSPTDGSSQTGLSKPAEAHVRNPAGSPKVERASSRGQG